MTATRRPAAGAAAPTTQLADLVEVPVDTLDAPTPCAAYTVETLRDHVLAWLQFFSAALTDPTGSAPRPDPDSWNLGEVDPGDVVRRAHAIRSLLMTGLSSVPFDLFEVPLTDDVRRIAADRALIARYCLDRLDATS